MKDLNFVGIGGAYALELGGNCAYIKDSQHLLVIDCCEDATVKLNNKNAFSDVTNITIAITHTHADHVAGIGPFIWYCNFLLNIKPKIISNSKTFETATNNLFKLLGIDSKFYEFVNASSVVIDNCSIEMLPTTHTPMLECFGIMFTDNIGKYYYTGDTKDFEFVKSLVNSSDVKKVYCETNWQSYNVHISYEDLKTIKSDKLVLMHFESLELYNLAIKDGFNVAKL